MAMNFALVGNPNCGKTTMFNSLTGSSQYVGNWPGVTVEKKEGKLKGYKDVKITDLPGIYSLSPYTLEEVVSRDFLVNEKPDVIINLVDATNLERNLYLTSQLLELGIPVVVALNLIDVTEKRGDKIDYKKLSDALGCSVIPTSALKGTGLSDLISRAVFLAGSAEQSGRPQEFCERVERALSEISVAANLRENARYLSIKLFERDEKAYAKLGLSADVLAKIGEIIAACEEDEDDDSESIITNERYIVVSDICSKAVKEKKTGLTTSDKIDRIVTNRWLALPIFAAVMFIVYYISVSSLGAIVTDWTNDVLFGTYITDWASAGLAAINASPVLEGLILDGIIGGVGAVLGFVPQMLILFFFLSILEDCGYMARVAFIMDRIFRKFGLSGKSFIPMLISSGCGVPGIMASRTIENEKDRKMTIMTTTFIPCGAKLPIIALIAGALFGGSPWIAPLSYFIGVFAVIVSGIILKKTRGFAGDPAPFVLELPEYHVPGAKGVLIHMWERGKAFIIKAGTVIFIACGLIWFLSNFSFGFKMVEQSESILAKLGSVLSPVFAPLGFGNWQATVATISGLVAKENVVGTFGVLFGLGGVAEDDPTLLAAIAGMFSQLSAISFMLFNLLCAPCFAAIGAIRREMGGFKWTMIAILYQTGFAYVISLIVYQIGRFAFGSPFSIGTAAGFIAFFAMVWLIFRSAPKTPGSPLSGTRAVKERSKANV